MPDKVNEAFSHIDLILRDLGKFANAEYGQNAPNFGLALVMLAATEPIARIVTLYTYDEDAKKPALAETSNEVRGFTYWKKFFELFNDPSYKKHAAFIYEVCRNGLVHAYTPRKITRIDQIPEHDYSALSGIRYLGVPEINNPQDSEHEYLELIVQTNSDGTPRPAFIFNPIRYYQDLVSTVKSIEEKAGKEEQIANNIVRGWRLLGEERRSDFNKIKNEDPFLAQELIDDIENVI